MSEASRMVRVPLWLLIAMLVDITAVNAVVILLAVR
jgi:hypothetical protein